MVYEWTCGARFRVPAQVVAERLEQIAERDEDHRVTPAAVVADAMPPESPLHVLFEWDDQRAAHEHRLHQARQVVHSIVRIEEPEDVEEKPKTVRHYVSVTTDSGRGYVATSRVMTSIDLREQALAEALAGLRAWRERFSHLSELAEAFAVIDAAIEAAQLQEAV